jgi:hypothetical protein
MMLNCVFSGQRRRKKVESQNRETHKKRYSNPHIKNKMVETILLFCLIKVEQKQPKPINSYWLFVFIFKPPLEIFPASLQLQHFIVK